jgi:hypothetical protein
MLAKNIETEEDEIEYDKLADRYDKISKEQASLAKIHNDALINKKPQ